MLVNVDGTEKPAWKGLELITALMHLRDDKKTKPATSSILDSSDDEAEGESKRKSRHAATSSEDDGADKKELIDDSTAEKKAEKKSRPLTAKQMERMLERQRAALIEEFKREEDRERKEKVLQTKREQRDREIEAQIERDNREREKKQKASEDKARSKELRRLERKAAGKKSAAEKKAEKVAKKKAASEEKAAAERDEARRKQLVDLDKQKAELEAAAAAAKTAVVFPNPLAVAAAVEKKKQIEEQIKAVQEAQAKEDRERAEREAARAEEKLAAEAAERKAKAMAEKLTREQRGEKLTDEEKKKAEMSEKEWAEYVRKEKADIAREMQAEADKKAAEAEEMKNSMAKEWKEYEKWKAIRLRDRNFNRNENFVELERKWRTRDSEWQKKMRQEMDLEARSQLNQRELVDASKFKDEAEKREWLAKLDRDREKAEAERKKKALAAIDKAMNPNEEKFMKMWKLEDDAERAAATARSAASSARGSARSKTGSRPLSATATATQNGDKKSGRGKPGIASSKPGTSQGSRPGTRDTQTRSDLSSREGGERPASGRDGKLGVVDVDRKDGTHIHSGSDSEPDDTDGMQSDRKSLASDHPSDRSDKNKPGDPTATANTDSGGVEEVVKGGGGGGKGDKPGRSPRIPSMKPVDTAAALTGKPSKSSKPKSSIPPRDGSQPIDSTTDTAVDGAVDDDGGEGDAVVDDSNDARDQRILAKMIKDAKMRAMMGGQRGGRIGRSRNKLGYEPKVVESSPDAFAGASGITSAAGSQMATAAMRAARIGVKSAPINSTEQRLKELDEREEEYSAVKARLEMQERKHEMLRSQSMDDLRRRQIEEDRTAEENKRSRSLSPHSRSKLSTADEKSGTDIIVSCVALLGIHAVCTCVCACDYSCIGR